MVIPLFNGRYILGSLKWSSIMVSNGHAIGGVKWSSITILNGHTTGVTWSLKKSFHQSKILLKLKSFIRYFGMLLRCRKQLNKIFF